MNGFSYYVSSVFVSSVFLLTATFSYTFNFKLELRWKVFSLTSSFLSLFYMSIQDFLNRL